MKQLTVCLVSGRWRRTQPTPRSGRMEREYIKRHAPLDTPKSSSARPATTTHIHHCLTASKLLLQKVSLLMLLVSSQQIEQDPTSVQAVGSAIRSPAPQAEPVLRAPIAQPRHSAGISCQSLHVAASCEECMCKGCMQVQHWSHFISLAVSSSPLTQ